MMLAINITGYMLTIYISLVLLDWQWPVDADARQTYCIAMLMMMKLPILPCAEKLELVLSIYRTKNIDNNDKDVSPRCVSCVKSATRCRQPHSRCWWSLWFTRDCTMEIACWWACQLTCYVSSSRSWTQPPVWCITWKLATTSPMHLSVFTGCGPQNGYCTRQLFWHTSPAWRHTTLPQFASACRRRAWSTSTPLCRIEPFADSAVQTVNHRRSSVSGRSSTVLEQASWQCCVGQFVVGFSAVTETHSVPAVIPRHYPVTFLNCNNHSGPSSGIAT